MLCHGSREDADGTAEEMQLRVTACHDEQDLILPSWSTTRSVLKDWVITIL